MTTMEAGYLVDTTFHDEREEMEIWVWAKARKAR
jgi:hypothetical protein